MTDPDANVEVQIVLSCPVCGETLAAVPANDGQLCCPTHHQFTLPTLLLNQSARAASLFGAGTRLLDEQERLVRAIAEQIWTSQPLVAFKLEGQAERLRETTEAIRQIIAAGAVEQQPLKDFESHSN